MIVPNPIRLAIASAAFGAGVTMIVFGALKGAVDIIKDNEQKRAADQEERDVEFVEPEFLAPEPEFVVNVEDLPADESDDYSV